MKKIFGVLYQSPKMARREMTKIRHKGGKRGGIYAGMAGEKRKYGFSTKNTQKYKNKGCHGVIVLFSN